MAGQSELHKEHPPASESSHLHVSALRHSIVVWKRSLVVMKVVSIALAMVVATVLAMGMGPGITRSPLGTPLMLALVLLTCVPHAVLGWRRRSDLMLRIQVLRESADLDASGPLLDVIALAYPEISGVTNAQFMFPGTSLSKAASSAVCVLAPFVSAWSERDFRSLTSKQRGLARAIVERGVPCDSVRLRHALCTALARVGGREDLEVLRYTADTEGDRAFREAVREAADQLAARLERQARTAMLLHPTSAPESGPEEMLRAVASPPCTPAEELLRSAAGHEEKAP